MATWALLAFMFGTAVALPSNWPVSRSEVDMAEVFRDGLGSCSMPGAECNVAKRVAVAVTHAIRTPLSPAIEHFDGENNVCKETNVVEGTASAAKLRRDSTTVTNDTSEHYETGYNSILDSVAIRVRRSYHSIWAREVEAEVEAQAHGPKLSKRLLRGQLLFCGLVGGACVDKRHIGFQHNSIGFCGARGSSCAEKREAFAAAEAIAIPGFHGLTHFYYCGVRGSACVERRSTKADHYDSPTSTNPSQHPGFLTHSYTTKDALKHITKVRDTFYAAKSEAQAQALLAPDEKLQLCNNDDHCTNAAALHLQARITGDPRAEEAESSTVVRSIAIHATDDMETAINAAITRLMAT